MSSAFSFIRGMFSLSNSISWYSPFAIGAIVFIALVHAVSSTKYKSVLELPAQRLYTPFLLTTMLWLVFIFRARNFAPFIYFQF